MSSTDPTQRDLDARGTDLHRDSVVRHEEELAVTRQTQQIGTVRVDKHVETLADGSVSIPVFEEELVITKRRVLRERIIVRKRVVTEQETVQADLLRERVEVDVQGDIDVDGLTSGG